MNDFIGNTPLIPDGLLHEMYEIKVETKLDKQAGGQFKPKKPEQIPFNGVVLPVSDKDLQRAPVGTYTQHSEKIYTNDYMLQVGGQVLDPYSGITYTVTQELDHNYLSPIKRYVAEAKGRSAPKQ